jgi:hypothetical protein
MELVDVVRTGNVYQPLSAYPGLETIELASLSEATAYATDRRTREEVYQYGLCSGARFERLFSDEPVVTDTYLVNMGAAAASCPILGVYLSGLLKSLAVQAKLRPVEPTDVRTLLKGVRCDRTFADGYARACVIINYEEGLERLMRMETEGDLGEWEAEGRFAWLEHALDEAVHEDCIEMFHHIEHLIASHGLGSVLATKCAHARAALRRDDTPGAYADDRYGARSDGARADAGAS